jgi:hypothetical protein
MQCNEIEAVLEQNGLESLPEAARQHATECSACRNFLADLNEIISMAHELPAEVTPPDRVWNSLRAQLEAEGIIRTPARPETRSTRRAWLPQFAGSRGWIAATAGLLVLAAAGLQIYRRPLPVSTPVAEQTSGVAPSEALEQTSKTLRQAENDLSSMRQAGTLSHGEEGNSVADDSLQKNLKAVDEFIVECEQHLREDPQDQLAHEYLSRAYQQKAQLISALLDSGRSEN